MANVPQKSVQDWLFNNFWGILVALFFLIKDLTTSSVKIDTIGTVVANNTSKIELLQELPRDIKDIKKDVTTITVDMDSLKNMIRRMK